METENNDAATEARDAELTRIAGINEAFNTRWAEPKHRELQQKMIADGASIDEARNELLQMIGLDKAPANQASASETVTNPPSRNQALASQMEEALGVRCGNITDKDAVQRCQGNNEFAGMTLVEMARSWLRINGQPYSGDAMRVVGRAMDYNVRADTTDFPEILANVAFNQLLKAYWDAPETWQMWAGVGNIQDFKLNHRSNISEFDTLPVVAEGATYTEGAFTDLGERIQLATYGKVWNITREAIINDSLNAFTRVPTAMGLAAARTVGNLAYNVLFLNAALNQDATALFDVTTHKNTVDVGGGPPDADTVQAGKVAMALQQGPALEATLGIRPQYLLCPVGLEGVCNTLMAAQYNPASTAGTLEPNVVQGLMTVVSDHRMDADDPLQWYMAAGPGAWDTIEVAFLNGNRSPYQERRNQDINNDNITYKVRIDAAAAAMDFRGLYRNVGA